MPPVAVRILFVVAVFLAVSWETSWGAAGSAQRQGPTPAPPLWRSLAPGGLVAHKPVVRPDSTQARLEELQDALKDAMTALAQAPAEPPGGFLQVTKDELTLAQGDVAHALDYLRTHPDDSSLAAAVPLVGGPDGFATTHPMITSRLEEVFPAAGLVEAALLPCLPNFVEGVDAPTPAAPRKVCMVTGSIGGYRDKILRDVGLAIINFSEYTRDWHHLPNPPPDPAGPALPAKPGGISGVVVDSAGDPVPFALVSILLNTGAMKPSNSQTQFFSGYCPVTVTDAHGAYAISDLPPGDYAVSANLAAVNDSGFWRLRGSVGPGPVEVREATETKLASPLVLIGSQ